MAATELEMKSTGIPSYTANGKPHFESDMSYLKASSPPPHDSEGKEVSVNLPFPLPEPNLASGITPSRLSTPLPTPLLSLSSPTHLSPHPLSSPISMFGRGNWSPIGSSMKKDSEKLLTAISASASKEMDDEFAYMLKSESKQGKNLEKEFQSFSPKRQGSHDPGEEGEPSSKLSVAEIVTSSSSSSSQRKRGTVSRRGGRIGAPSPLHSYSQSDHPLQMFSDETSFNFQKPAEHHPKPFFSKEDSKKTPLTSSPHSLPTAITSSSDISNQNKQIYLSSSGSSSSHLSPLPSCKPALNPQFSPLHSEKKDKPPTKLQKRKPSSITVDTSCETSPLHLEAPEEKNAKSPERKKEADFCSPQTPTPMHLLDKKIPLPNPKFSSLTQLSFQDSKLNSPCPIFLSPYSPSLGLASPLPREHNGESKHQKGMETPNPDSTGRAELATPTNFASDFKHEKGGLFDSTNPFSWLNSPQAIFPPTPKQCDQTETENVPATPTFFLQDASKLKKDIHTSHPYSNMICISPLAPSKSSQKKPPTYLSPFKQNRIRSNSIDFHDFFASPRNARMASPKMLPLDLGASDAEEGLNLPMHMAERDLMEDEDLSMLLQIASSTGNIDEPHTSNQRGQLSSLQLPLISGPEKSPKLKPSSEYYHPNNNLGTHNAPSVTPQRTNQPNTSGHTAMKTQKETQKDIQPTMLHLKSHDGLSYVPYPPTNSTGKQLMPPSMAQSAHRHGVGQGNPMSHPHPHFHMSNAHGVMPPSQPMPKKGQVPSPYPPPAENHYYPNMHVNPGHMHPYQQYPAYTHPPHKKKTPVSTLKKGRGKSKKRPSDLEDKAKKKKKGNVLDKKKAKKGSTPNQKGVQNVVPGAKHAHAAALAAAILRGVTMRPSGKWQAQLYYAGKSRYIGVFDTREKAALAYEIAREKLKSENSPNVNSQSVEDTEAAVSSARKAAFEGVNEPDPRPPHKR